ncbi:hypothetical protein F5878DRAFT_617015 [Lentinula raphanica]|uniref:DUF6533 domain-containing protein n=1 Tax=Lentinula raphanica TaxID=153919 RepID=A0AA38PAD3_9AGAR|nr:hypothetical protein F5878DRAFT_617015 [Lentinula raphanica]
MDPLQKEEIITSLEGLEIARTINIACVSLAVYEWFITLDQEVIPTLRLRESNVERRCEIEQIDYFWNGRWSFQRILFFCNRYIPPFLVMFGLIQFSVLNPSDEFCISAIRFSFFASIIALNIIQVMLLLRIWYLFSDNKIIQYGMLFLWVFSLTISLAYTGVAATNVRVLNKTVWGLGGPGCRVARPEKFWRMFTPSLGLHAVMYMLTAARALRNRRILKEAPVLQRLIRDGGLFFFVVFVSVGFNTVGSFLVHVPQINIPVIFSNYLLTVTSIAMSRIMFSIHSLASHLGSDTGWLLSNVELRRVDWRKGATEGELIVECATSGQEDDLDDMESTMRSYYDGSVRSRSGLKVSRVGVYNDDTMWS